MSALATSGIDDLPYNEFDLEEGFAYPRFEVTISTAEQRRLHAWSDIPASVFGHSADPALVSRLPIVVLAHTVIARRPDLVPVHTVQRIVQRRPIGLDETLRLDGRIDALEPHPRGETLHSAWRYFDVEESCVFEVHPQALLIDPARSRTSAPAARSTDACEWHVLGRKQCTPEATLGYCEGTRNPIHLDPDVARSFGFRAPIIAGTQTMSFLLEALYREQRPRALDVSIGFHRPVFWDDRLGIEAEAGAVPLRYLRAVNDAGRTVADCAVDAVS